MIFILHCGWFIWYLGSLMFLFCGYLCNYTYVIPLALYFFRDDICFSLLCAIIKQAYFPVLPSTCCPTPPNFGKKQFLKFIFVWFVYASIYITSFYSLKWHPLTQVYYRSLCFSSHLFFPHLPIPLCDSSIPFILPDTYHLQFLYCRGCVMFIILFLSL